MLAWALPVALMVGAPCPTRSMRLDWVRADAASSCSTGEEVVRFVQQRLQCTPFSAEADAWFEVYVEPAESGWRAKLQRYDAEGQKLTDKVLHSSDSDCAVLGEVVALTLAVIAAELPRLPDPPSSTKTATTAKTKTSTQTNASQRDRVAVRPQSNQQWETLVEIPPRGTASVEAVLSLGTFASASWGFKGGAALHLSDRFSAELGVLVLPVHSEGPFFLGITAASLGACAHFEPVGARFDACARLYGGAVMGFAKAEVTPVDPGPYPWIATSFGGGLSVRLLGPVFIRLGAEAVITLLSRVFTDATTQDEVFNESPVAFLGSAGLSVQFR